jgi:hypothetical protein
MLGQQNGGSDWICTSIARRMRPLPYLSSHGTVVVGGAVAAPRMVRLRVGCPSAVACPPKIFSRYSRPSVVASRLAETFISLAAVEPRRPTFTDGGPNHAVIAQLTR